MACSGPIICVQFTRSPMRTVVKSGAGPDSQTGCLCAATSRAQYQMAATCNMHRFQCRHQPGHRFPGADLCTRASRGHTVSTKRLARGKQCRRLRHFCAKSDAADTQLAKMVRIVFGWACTFNAPLTLVTLSMRSATLPVVTIFFAMALACLSKGMMFHVTRSNRRTQLN